MITPSNATRAWFGCVEDLFLYGESVSPRGIGTIELPQHTMVVDMDHPVVVSPTRKVVSKFLGAEARWILTGDDRVETIAPYNKHIGQFSDDGQTFFGAYGPRIQDQLDFVVGKLMQDPDSRQAGLTTWRQNPPQTKDMPCTIAMFFSIRNGLLNNHVFMRSSDVWLGVPYDVFNFSMVAMQVLCRLNSERLPGEHYRPGALYLTAASRHLYDTNSEAALLALQNDPWRQPTNPVPVGLWTNEDELIETLRLIREGVSSARWWVPDPTNYALEA
jgi:thymidylate synthase